MADRTLLRAQEALAHALEAAKNTAANPLASAMSEVTDAFSTLADADISETEILELKKQLQLLMRLCHLLQATSQKILQHASVIEGAGYGARRSFVGSNKPLFRRYG